MKTIRIAVSLALLTSSASVLAISDAAKLGANAGAMEYCRDNIASSDDRGKYNLLAIKTLRLFKDIEDDKMKAMVMKKAAEDGDYLGNPLTKKRCDSVRKILYLQYRDD